MVFTCITACALADPQKGPFPSKAPTVPLPEVRRFDCYRLKRLLPDGFYSLPLDSWAFSRRTRKSG